MEHVKDSIDAMERNSILCFFSVYSLETGTIAAMSSEEPLDGYSFLKHSPTLDHLLVSLSVLDILSPNHHTP